MQRTVLMTELVLVILLLISISFLCSLLEAVILSITRPYIQSLLSEGRASGRLLHRLKETINEPISAILTLNTISHTVGAAVSGAIALQIFGSEWMALFSAILTLLILVLSEIIPKTIGAYYWKTLGPLTAYILKVLIIILKPLIIPVNVFSRAIGKKNPAASISRDEIINFIRLGYFQGTINSPEYTIMENLFRLDAIRVKQIMTPRTVVYWLEREATVAEVLRHDGPPQFSRIPLYDPHKNMITGVVMRRDIMDSMANKKTNTKIGSLSAKPEFILENASVYRLFNSFIEKKIQFMAVINEYGDYVGIVTMEDAIETLLGIEIVDEFDPAEDMQKVAQEQGKKRLMKIIKRKQRKQ